ncbi:hypothetical protein jhhlp_004977 [Lomentospora prolificans]|uniref:thioredoxin-dependent peroxiredoxin n=1 Tax=Lomentospora prolificans TaxID=41688 RepID=A0A2N3N807_9PEZI|nr:hypothetical protein jhhlp_004977 [Lomentospora prolificans]
MALEDSVLGHKNLPRQPLDHYQNRISNIPLSRVKNKTNKMNQRAKLDECVENFSSKAPESIKAMAESFKQTTEANFDPKGAVQPGAKLPDFTMTNVFGNEVTSASLLSKGPLLITFYRGSWCSLCNIALPFLQKHLSDFEARGAQIVAITPELPEGALATVEKHNLKFHVLSDVGNKLARQLGIIHPHGSIREAMQMLGSDLQKSNGDDSWDLPFPATLLVDRSGIVRNVYLDLDITNRLDPEEALRWVDNMNKE